MLADSLTEGTGGVCVCTCSSTCCFTTCCCKTQQLDKLECSSGCFSLVCFVDAVLHVSDPNPEEDNVTHQRLGNKIRVNMSLPIYGPCQRAV